MAKKEYEFFDVNQFRVDVEESVFSKQTQITLTLPKDILYYILQGITELTTKSILTIVSRDDKVINKPEDGGVITTHGIQKYKIFRMVLVLDQILKLDHYQEIYDHSWEFDKNVEKKDYDHFVEEGSEEDFFQRYMSILEMLYLLTGKEGLVPYPSEVKRFCDKLRSMHSEEYWKEAQEKFWKEVGQHIKKKEKGTQI